MRHSTTIDFTVDRRPLPRSLLALCLFELAFYLAYRYGMSFSSLTASPFWFPDSVLLCALLVSRPRWWWLLLLATLPIRLLVAVPPATPVWFLLGTFAIDCTSVLLAAALLHRLTRNPTRFESPRDFGLYFVIVAVLAPALSAFGGAAARHARGSDYWLSWQQWFYGDVLAGVIITPFIFYWILNPIPTRLHPARAYWAEPILLTCGLIGSSWLAFGPTAVGLEFTDSRFYAPVPFLFWAAIRFGVFGASGAMALLSFAAVAAALLGRGPFAGSTPANSAANLQYFLLLRAVPLYIVAVLIEHSQKVAQSLRETEQRFRVMADTAPVLIWMSGTDGLCDFFNQGWLEFTGRSALQEQGSGWTAGVHPEDYRQCLATYESSFAARQPFEMDYRLRRHDGEYRWILDKGVPRFAADGGFLGYIGTAVDITERRNQEAALRESEERYREVVESQTDFVCRLLPDMTLTFVNDAYCRFLGRMRKDLLGTQLPALMPESARGPAEDRILSAASSTEPAVWECEAERPDGSMGWQQWICHRVVNSKGELLEYQLIGHDVTDRKHAEEADRNLSHASRLAALGELSALIAHEINQPLCAILSNAEAGETLVQLPEPPLAEIRQIFADICRDDRRADEAIRRIRALMQKRDMRLQPISINDTVAGVLRLVAGDALRRRVSIRREFAADLPQVSADRAYLEQVLLNLIANGMDAMDATTGPARQLTIQTRLNGGGSVEVAVMDFGSGISEAKMPHLFDTFFTTKAEGMGLGLSIARSIIQAHHGRIWAENRAVGGAVLRFAVPAATADTTTDAGGNS